MPEVHFSNPIYLSVYRLNVRMVDRYRQGRVFLAGDAAHVHAPAGGQGMNTGIQDAYNLSWKLSNVLNGAPEALLDTYEAERLPVARNVLSSTSERIHSWTKADSNGTSAGVQNMVQMIEGKDPFSDVTQVSVHYRWSSLVRDLRETEKRHAGDRAPDGCCLRDGQKVRLFELFQGTHFTLLLFGEQPRPQLPAAVHVYTIDRSESTHPQLIDPDGRLHEAYEVSGKAMILVRPDGYIALNGEEYDEEQILAYLQEVGNY
jgi:hypothetical protein